MPRRKEEEVLCKTSARKDDFHAVSQSISSSLSVDTHPHTHAVPATTNHDRRCEANVAAGVDGEESFEEPMKYYADFARIAVPISLSQQERRRATIRAQVSDHRLHSFSSCRVFIFCILRRAVWTN